MSVLEFHNGRILEPSMTMWFRTLLDVNKHKLTVLGLFLTTINLL